MTDHEKQVEAVAMWLQKVAISPMPQYQRKRIAKALLPVLLQVREALVHSDSALSYIRHRGTIDWTSRVGFNLTEQEVDHRIGESRETLATLNKLLEG